MSAWVLGLLLGAGYLFKNHKLPALAVAESEYQGAANPATDGVTTAELRATRKDISHTEDSDFNSKLPQAERNVLLEAQGRQRDEVAAFNGETAGHIQGVFLQYG